MLDLDSNVLTHYLNQLNSIGKIAVFLISWAVIWIPIILPILWINKWQKPAPNPNTYKLTLILSLYSLAPFLIWAVTKIEDITLKEIGIVWQVSLLQSILFGYCLSIAVLFLVYAGQFFLGWLRWKNKPQLNVNFALTFIPLLLISFVIGAIEELVFRGVLVYFLQIEYSVWITAIVSSFIFAVLHLIWEQKNTLPQIPGLWLMGLVLFYSCVVTNGSLGLAIGLHSGWVLILASVDTFDLFDYNPDYPGWLIGIKEQPLGSIVGLMVLCLTTISLFFWHILA